MARKHNAKELRDIIGSLDYKGVPVGVIHRRLRNDDVGLGFKVDISKRAVYYHRTAYRTEHGPPPELTSEAAVDESIAATKLRLVALLRREVAALERKKPGTITTGESRNLNAHHKSLTEIQAREARQAKRAKRTAVGRARAERQEPLTAIELLAQREAENLSRVALSEPGASERDRAGVPGEASEREDQHEARGEPGEASNGLDGEGRSDAQPCSAQASTILEAFASAT